MPEVYYLLACFGLTFAICDASIFNRPRDFLRERSKLIAEFLMCYFCAGFWASLALYLALFWETMGPEITFMAVAWTLAHAFAGAAFCYLVFVMVDYLELSTVKKQLFVTEEELKRDLTRYDDGA